jgi:hypothetical protein
MATLKTVDVYFDQSQMLVAKSLLEAHGIWTTAPEWYHTVNAWHYTFALGGVRLCVLDSDEIKAKQLLQISPNAQTLKSQFSIRNAFIAIVFFFLIGMPYPVRRPGKLVD